MAKVINININLSNTNINAPMNVKSSAKKLSTEMVNHCDYEDEQEEEVEDDENDLIQLLYFIIYK